MLNFPSSLVKYSTPVLISTGVRKDGSSKKQAIYDFFPKKESEVDKSVDISRWIQVISKNPKPQHSRIWNLGRPLKKF